MDRKIIFKQMLPGLLPLFIFILADEIWGTETGLYVALGFGLLELAYTYIRDRRIERFILFDTGLLLALGAVSILLENEIFFKLKPALIEALLCVILGLSAFTSKNIMLNMTERFTKKMNLEIQDEQVRQMQKTSAVMFFLVLAHVAMIVYSAYFMSKEAWAFISGVLFYIIMGVFFAGQLVRARVVARR